LDDVVASLTTGPRVEEVCFNFGAILTYNRQCCGVSDG
jgi:hypothetical protein